MVYTEYHPGHSIERLVPDGTVNLILEMGNVPQYIYDNESLEVKQEYKGSWISGMQSGYISISASAYTSMFVIQFKPAGAFPILQLPLSELKNQVIDAALVLGPAVKQLREHLLEAAAPPQKFQLASEWLYRRMTEQGVPEAVIRFAVQQTGQSPTMNNLQAIADQTGYSQRHFIQLFKKHVGLAPKQYQRIVRFNQVLQRIDQGQAIDWATTAYECGYFDQAHFIKEFKAFSGFSPGQFLLHKGDYINYVPIG